MADAQKKSETPSSARKDAGTAGPASGDRVQMLSLRKDGTPDQHDPQLIGDREVVEAATREQFRQRAVSRADEEARGVASSSPALVGKEDGSVEEVDASELPQDPSIDKLAKAHEDAAKSGESDADAAISSLYKGK